MISASQALKLLLPIISGFSRHRSWLALCLIDMLSINGGYFFRMLLSRRDSINKLVARLPAKPSPRGDELHTFILYLIKKWRMSFWEVAKHREDFNNVKSMYDLLASKSTRPRFNWHLLFLEFVFPQVSQEDIDAITVIEVNVQKDDEQAAERERMEAKLDFLLHRGSLADLNAANELMKTMAGYEVSKSSI